MRFKAITTGVAVLVLGLVSAELYARFGLGLGDPPLTVRDPEIEYLFAPSQCYTRFGNRVCYNEWSMRSNPLSKEKGSKCRFLILGDSVVNGGALLDQSEIASEIVAKATGCEVGNISAGSWGPANLLAYTERYGWFGADWAIIVVSASDLSDVPTFQADLGVDFPERQPPLALWELLTRYVPRYMPSPASSAEPVNTDHSNDATPTLDLLIRSALKAVPHVAVLFHPEASEKSEGAAIAAIKVLCERSGAQFVVTAHAADHYLDNIHLTAGGQAALAAAILRTITEGRQRSSGGETIRKPVSNR